MLSVFSQQVRTTTIVSLVLAFLAVSTNAQTNPRQKASPEPTPKADLLIVNPATPVASPVAAPTPPGGAQETKPENEIDDKQAVITNTDLITFNVTVTDVYGRFVSGLKQSAFSVFDDKDQENITFFSDADAPVSVGIVFDLTGSMSGEKVQRAKDALSHFMQTSDDRDEYFLITLQNGRAYLTMDRTRDSKALLEKLTLVQAKGNTAFYDGVYLAANRVQRGTYPKRAVLVISDGQDNNSRYTFNNLRKALKESDVEVYCVGIEESGNGSLALEGSGILDEISGVSGGKAFFPRSGAEMDDIFEQIALELRHQYSIGYKPADFTTDGRWHGIKVKVSPPRGLPRLYVRSKEGYFAQANPK
jgi:Ca-activated chloride channel family protein